MPRLILFVSLFTLIFISGLANASYIEVTLLGTGTPRPNIERMGPSTLVEVKGRYFLFDTGRGTTVRLQQAGIRLSQIEHIFYTHLHSDHTSGIADLLMTSWIWQRPHQLQLTGPTGVKGLAKHTRQAFEHDMRYRAENTGLDPQLNDITAHELTSDEIVYDQDGIKITAFLVDHGVVKPAFGYKIQSGENTVVISGDTTYSENLVQHAKNAKLLVHEIAASGQKLLEKNPRLQKVMSYHTDPKQLAKIVNQIKPELTVLTHILLFGINEKSVIEAIAKIYDGRVVMGKDLIKIGVGEKVTIRSSN